MNNTDTAEELSNIRSTLETLPLHTILYALAIFVAGFVLIRLILAVTGKLLRRTRLDNSLHRFLQSILRVVLWFCLLLTVAAYVGIDITSLVALLSVVSLAVSLSVQNALSNVAGGMMVIGTKPFKQGDYVSVDDLEGTVDEIGVVYTKLHTIDNRAVLIPNAKVSTATIQNFTALGKRRLDMEFSASYDSDPATVEAALRAAVARCQPMRDEDLCVEFQSFDDSAICYHVHFWVPSARFVQARFELRRYVYEAFRDAGVEMTYPHLNVHLQDDLSRHDGGAD